MQRQLLIFALFLSACTPTASIIPIETDQPFDPLSIEIEVPTALKLDVPFSPQAPFADWSPLYQEACEEASLLMVEYYLSGEPFTRDIADQEIIELSQWEELHGYAVDIDAAEVASIANERFGRRARVYRGDDVTIENIKHILASGYPIIIPAAGQMLGNPYFSGDGPPYHMLVITGYTKTHFITNDPGTRRGEDYKYLHSVIMDSIHDWTGSKETIRSGPKAMVVVGHG